MADTGLTQLNDITLSIPPESIQVNRRSFNHEWQTLRTRSSTKVKSGFSQIDITMVCKFTDDALTSGHGTILNGYTKLRDLVSQFRVTPFCFVENQFLRNTILAGANGQTMALALRQMEIAKNDDTTNVVTVTFNFSWFNYLPYTKNFSFKRDIFVGDEVTDPTESEAWKLLYQAEQRRVSYLVVDKLKTFTRLSYSEFNSVHVVDYARLQKEADALTGLRKVLSGMNANDLTSGDVSDTVKEFLTDQLNNEAQADLLIRDTFGDSTSMNGSNDIGEATEKDVKEQVLKVIDLNLHGTNEAVSRYDVVVNTEWKPVQLADKTIVKFKNEPTKPVDDEQEFDKSTTVLLRRSRSLAFEQNDIVTTGLTISFENILATLPMIGHPFPTFQHIGSIDARIALTLLTTTEDGVKKLSDLYSAVEDQSRKYRIVPAGQRNITIDNDLINMCGIQEAIPESMTLETVPGLPGTTSAMLVLVDNPITSKTAEKFTQEGSFIAGSDLRLKIAEVLENNLKLISDAFVADDNGSVNLRGLKLPEVTVDFSSSPGPGTNNWSQAIIKTQQSGEPSYYIYTGSKDTHHERFRSLCEDYAREYGQLLANVFPAVKAAVQSPQKTTFRPEDFFSLKDLDVFGIEKMQNDIESFLASTKFKSSSILESNAGLIAQIQAGNVGQVIKQTDNINAQAQQTEAYFKVLNDLRDVKNSFVLDPAAKEEIISEKTEAAEAFKSDERIAVLLNAYFTKWISFANAFLDKILYTGIIALPEFKPVRDIMNQKALQASCGAYPDFPLDELVGILQTAKGGNLQHSFRRLTELFDKSGLGLKNLNMSVLINPDFFYFNAQNDVQETIIPNTIIKTAARNIIDAREQMLPAERDWFAGAYQNSIIGAEKAAKTEKLLTDSQVLPEFLSFLKTSPGRSYKDALDTSFQEYGLAPNLLVGSIASSLAEASQLPQSIGQGEGGTGDNSVTIKSTNISNDIHNSRSNYNLTTHMVPKDEAVFAVKHRFETADVLGELSEVEYLPKTNDPSEVPIITWPTPSYCRRITSRFGPRAQPVAGGSTNHPGVDMAVNVRNPKLGIEASAGIAVYAAADGIIASAKYLPNYGVILAVKHSGNCTTRYVHLALDEQTQRWIDIINRTGDFKTIGPSEQEDLLSVRQLDQIARISKTVPVSTAAHLHFEMYIGGQLIDPEPYLTGDAYKSRGPIKGIQPQTDSVLSKSVEQFENDLRRGQGFTMMRAFPTFKLYFIESDAGERKRFSFDDFFSYSSVKEIQVVRSRKLAADLCVIQLTNISGVLSNRKFSNSLDPTKPKDANGQNAKEEGPIASLMLQPGIQIQLRLGYSNNPEELDTIFNGAIVDVEFTDTDDLVTITCQSYAYELVQTVHGEVKDFGGFLDGDGRTFKILEEIMASPEVVHFGRWEGGNVGINNNRGLLTKRWRLIPAPQDDNIFAPMGQTELGIWDSFISTTKYIMYQTTIWDVFQEMCLRHPSYVASAVPYEGKYGPRMTMFFGLPDQLYFARDSNFKEDNIVQALQDVVKTGHQDDASAAALDDIRDSNFLLDADKLQDFLDEDLNRKTAEERDRWFQLLAKQYSLDKGYIRPFRSYHLLTSSLHILYNSLSSSAHNTFNTVTLQYGKKSPEFDEDTATVNFKNLETFTLRADEAIPDEETREMFAQYPNCVGYEMAKQYAVGLLYNSLKEAYKGEVVIVGNPKIKPYDVCYLFDEYTDMFGPIEVEQVVHRFSQETGFITEITPDLMVHVNQHSTLSTNDAMGLIAEHAIRSIGIPSLPAIVQGADTLSNFTPPGALVGLTNLAFSPIATMVFNTSENSLGQGGEHTPFGMVGAFIFRKLITRSQLAHPFRFSPLVLGGKPMIGGLPNRRSDGTFIQKIGKWFKESGEGLPLLLDDTIDRLRPNNWLTPLSEGDITTLFTGDK